ncbi:rab guanine nucleotide exchange factor S2 [Ophidiomyces ophidiicola]|nr:rab guanine nucleotide exchange factor S2 [Ophidiomyces ophidiicola]KAI1990452.1 rab guanine nucleotide exchange factor S2 [Ophidiomyces ophidiicola]KAI1991384.1 rab guanine nucleotide exchange factor S2 [Ophidiomyces ophidiicola]
MPPSSKLRSLSTKTVFRAKSTNALSDLVGGSKASRLSRFTDESDTSFNTLRDPRTASTTDLSQTATSSPRHPDLSNEVAALSEKLIQAINNQTTLDDTLAATRQELEVSRQRILQLEEENRNHQNDVSSGVLVRRDKVDSENMEIKQELELERTRRTTIEKEKKGMEQELADLTAALFEEANKMVAAAKKDREAVEKRNEQLQSQIKDTETLLASHQEQLAELKLVMQDMNHDCSDIRTCPSTAPVSPIAAQSQGNLNRLLEAMNLSPVTPGTGDISPAPSTSFSHLIKSVCRIDIQAYEDFHALLRQSSSSKPPSRAVSGSYSGLNVIGLGSLTGNNTSPQHQYRSSAPANPAASSATSSLPNGNSSTRNTSSYSHLKETKFFKRVLIEDIEPTLRLDIAPGISWLTRRSLISSICDGSLIIEPMPSVDTKYSPACALCGERRDGDAHSRMHRFRTSDNDSAQRHPLCVLCLEKMRSCCDFVGYLRLIIGGHVRIGDEEEEKEAWEETVRLRERMFWSRIGGGVIPAFIHTDASTNDSAMQNHDPSMLTKVNGSIDQKIHAPKKQEEAVSSNVGCSVENAPTNPKKCSEQIPTDKHDADDSDDGTLNESNVDKVNDDDASIAKDTSNSATSDSGNPATATSKCVNGIEPKLKVTIPTVFEL